MTLETTQAPAAAQTTEQGYQPAQQATEAPPQQAQQEQAPQDPFRYRASTGSVYRDDAEMLRGVEEKDRFIQQLLDDRKALTSAIGNSGRQAQAPADGMTDTARKIYQRYVVEFPNTEREDLMRMAKVQADVVDDMRRDLTGSFQQTATMAQEKTQYAAIQAKDPRFNVNTNETARQIYNDPRYSSLGVEDHYALFVARVGPVGASNGNGHAAATAAASQYARPITPAGNGAGHNGGAGGLHPYVEQQISDAKARGWDDAAVERVRVEALRTVPHLPSNWQEALNHKKGPLGYV